MNSRGQGKDAETNEFAWGSFYCHPLFNEEPLSGPVVVAAQAFTA